LHPTDGSPPRVSYRKLPGDFRGILRRNSLWIGDDHLLVIDSSRFSETYKRFYLRDIQSIIVRRTPRFMVPYYWFLMAAVALIALLIGLNPFRESFFWPAITLLAGVAVYLYVASMFQSCTCHLVTRVNKVELPSLFRRWSARHFVDIMTPRIVAAQGELPADWVERSAILDEGSTAADRNPDTPGDLLPAAPFSLVTLLVFVCVLVDAGITWTELRRVDTRSLSLVNTVNMVTLAIASTISIVRLSRRRHEGGIALRALVVAGLFVVAGVTYGAILLQSFDQQFYHQAFNNTIQYPGMRSLALIEIIADCAVAVPGLILAMRQRREPSPPAVSFADASTPAGEQKS
jgi:hypothetical protein